MAMPNSKTLGALSAEAAHTLSLRNCLLLKTLELNSWNRIHKLIHCQSREMTGRIVSVLPILFLLMDGVMKLVKPAPVVAATIKLGYLESSIFGIGIVLIVCTVLYIIPRTSILGAILLTGYLGGAVAAHVRVGADLFSILFPVAIGVLVWLGVYLCDGRLRALIPLRR
jgi:DoxX-like family